MDTALDLEYKNLIQNNMEMFWKTCFATNPNYSVFKKNNIVQAVSDINDPLFNAVLAADIPENKIQQTVSDIIKFYQDKQLSFCWWVNNATASPELSKTLEKSAFISFGNVAGMLLEMDKVKLPYPQAEDIEIIAITATSDLLKWGIPLQTAFDMADTGISKYRLMFEKANDAGLCPFIHYIALVNNKVVGSSTLFLGDTTSIYNCATLPEYRGKGVLAALTTVMLNTAKKAGAAQVVLQASPMSAALFRKFGFIDVIPYHVYMKRIIPDQK